MTQLKLSPKVIVVITLTFIVGVSLYLRVYLPYERVFTNEWIKFTSVDAYYHMRLVDNLLSHFPQRIAFDPYTEYPNGTFIIWPPFFDWFLAGTIWLISLGSPTQSTIDMVGVYFPAILGTLTVIPVYFIGKELFNRWVGILAAGLLILLPSGFLLTSILGFTDHHVAETLFTTITILFMILAIKSARQRRFTFGHQESRGWAIFIRPVTYSILAGIFLGIYLLTWVGGLFFLLIIFIYFIIQAIIDHLRRENADYLVMVGTTSMLTALIVSLPLLPQTMEAYHLYLPSLAIAVLTPVGLVGLSHVFTRKKIKKVYYPVALIWVGLIGLAATYIVDPSLLQSMLGKFGIFNPSAAHLRIVEVQPLLFPMGRFSFVSAWSNFTTAFFLSFISLGILVYLAVKQGDPERILLVVWSLSTLAATLGQRRFGYYFAVDVALLTAYLSVIIFLAFRFMVDYLRNKKADYHLAHILRFAGFTGEPVKAFEIPKPQGGKKASTMKRNTDVRTGRISDAAAVLVIFFLVFLPNISLAVAAASDPPLVPDDAWYETLSWMKENTPEPFGAPQAYYEFYKTPQERGGYEYPESAYGVISWWDYGHWITRIAQRIPVSNPFQNGIQDVSEFFTAQDEKAANSIVDRVNSRYIIIDYLTTVGKFHGVAIRAGGTDEDFYDLFYRRVGSRLESLYLFYPTYYQSLAVRLYNFNGDGATAELPMVISYVKKTDREGHIYKEITSSQTFDSYEEAEAYISSQKSEDYIMVSTNPFLSPVPLSRLNDYKLVYSSTRKTNAPEIGRIPLIKVFEYTGQ